MGRPKWFKQRSAKLVPISEVRVEYTMEVFMLSLKSLKWKIGFASALGLAVLLNGVKASPSFDQAVLTASSNATQNSSQDSDLYGRFNPNSGSSNNTESSLFGSSDNSQFNRSNSNRGNSFSQSPSSRPNTRSRRS